MQRRAQIFKRKGNILKQTHKKNANMLQCGSKYKYFVENQYEDWKVCRKEKKHSVRRDRISEVLCQNIVCKQKKSIKAFKE